MSDSLLGALRIAQFPSQQRFWRPIKPENGIVTKGILTNKTGTNKVGAISKAQKAQKTFLKNLEIFDFFLSENVA